MRQFFITLGLNLLRSIGQSAIDSFWMVVIAAVVHMETEWREQGAGEIRKHEAVEKALQFLADRRIGNRLTRRWVGRFLEDFLDSVIQDVNNRLGHNWVNRVDDAREIIMRRIPVFN